MLPNKTKIGILGGGQLGKMLIEASRPWNIENVVLENDAQCPASLVANKVIVGSLYDAEKIKELASECDVITYEIEHVNVAALSEVEQMGKKVIPSTSVLRIIQNKRLQKQFYTEHNIPTAKYFIFGNREKAIADLALLKGEKAVVKMATGGYDGKGVQIVNKEQIIHGAFNIQEGDVIEELEESMLEISVIVAVDQDGNQCTFPAVEMYFNPRSNLVEFQFSPAQISEHTVALCNKIAMEATAHFQSPGLFAVEMFCCGDNRVLVNEIAPRPHNSGHHTIEGCFTSQFEQLNRILLGLPLGNTEMSSSFAAMVNLVGPQELVGKYQLESAKELLEMQGVYIHLYNKAEIKPDRKMGHITFLADSFEEMTKKAESIKQLSSFCSGQMHP